MWGELTCSWQTPSIAGQVGGECGGCDWPAWAKRGGGLGSRSCVGGGPVRQAQSRRCRGRSSRHASWPVPFDRLTAGTGRPIGTEVAAVAFEGFIHETAAAQDHAVTEVAYTTTQGLSLHPCPLSAWV
jgi:hypothetical protein